MVYKVKGWNKNNRTLRKLSEVAELYNDDRLREIENSIAEDCVSEIEAVYLRGITNLTLLETVVELIYDAGFQDGKECIRAELYNIMTPRRGVERND